MKRRDDTRAVWCEGGTLVPIAECCGFALHPSQPAPHTSPLIGA